jgi:hypothetical protein
MRVAAGLATTIDRGAARSSAPTYTNSTKLIE